VPPFYRRRPADHFNGVRDEIVELYAKGNTQDYIATAVGVSPAKVAKILSDEYKKNFAGRQELIEQVAWQLKKITRVALAKYDASDGTDNKSAETALKAIDQTRRMFGLDEATKVAISHSYDSMTSDELAIELAKYRISTTLSTPALPPAASPDSSLPIADAEFTSLPEADPIPRGEAETEERAAGSD